MSYKTLQNTITLFIITRLERSLPHLYSLLELYTLYENQNKSNKTTFYMNVLQSFSLDRFMGMGYMVRLH